MNLNEKTQKALEQWLSEYGATYHPCDIRRFNLFALLYCRDKANNISEKEFVKKVKGKTRTTKNENRGIAQKFYRRLQNIKSFYNDNEL